MDLKEWRKKTAKTSGALVRMRQQSYSDGVLPGKHKLLMALAISAIIKCEPCVKGYVKLAYENGVTEEELLETLDVVMTMGGCPGEEWSMIAYDYWKKLENSIESNIEIELNNDKEGCCD
ncbi:carboxymuconolactone decarboxylase family protein [Marinitoga sp. 1197]|uniref:carboxymuconolactone decarboxylase family protein n=1 Tax=Marinitoga sp. 1197 TaxID=1428449 RepID=UPI00069B94CA|nr:carboxymuconolactone decarboxylase family protein [Marinitoga sp. 1197]